MGEGKREKAQKKGGEKESGSPHGLGPCNGRKGRGVGIKEWKGSWRSTRPPARTAEREKKKRRRSQEKRREKPYFLELSLPWEKGEKKRKRPSREKEERLVFTPLIFNPAFGEERRGALSWERGGKKKRQDVSKSTCRLPAR